MLVGQDETTFRQFIFPKKHGGSVGMMHDTIIREVGLHPRIVLEVGNKQVMYFNDSIDGPFWMTSAQRLETKHNQQLGTARSRSKTKIELRKELWQFGYDTTKQRYLKDDLVALCGPRDIRRDGIFKAKRDASDTMGAWLDRLQ
jgi:hypothetical protein